MDMQDDVIEWGVVKPGIQAAIMDFFSSNQPVLLPDAKVDTDTGEMCGSARAAWANDVLQK